MSHPTESPAMSDRAADKAPASAAVDAAYAATQIVLKTSVPCPPARAFDYFTRDIGRWWPLARYSCGRDEAKDVRFETRVGGGIVETTRDGTTHRWGTVTVWNPGEQVAFSWHPGRDDSAAQWVEVTFAATTAGTLVNLTHGGFEKLGERAAKAKSEYESGWPAVFGRLYPAFCAHAVSEDHP